MSLPWRLISTGCSIGFAMIFKVEYLVFWGLLELPFELQGCSDWQSELLMSFELNACFAFYAHQTEQSFLPPIPFLFFLK